MCAWTIGVVCNCFYAASVSKEGQDMQSTIQGKGIRIWPIDRQALVTANYGHEAAFTSGFWSRVECSFRSVSLEVWG